MFEAHLLKIQKWSDLNLFKSSLYSIFQTAKQKNQKTKEKENRTKKKKGTAQLGRTWGPNRPSQPGKETSPAPFPLSLSHHLAGPACQLLLPRNHLPLFSPITGNGRRYSPAHSACLIAITTQP
jgi:hypothetical protein